MQAIENIIFDFGGVIYDIDYQRSIDEFTKLGAENFNEMYSQAIQNQLFERLETGAVSPDEFRNEIRQKLKPETTDEQIDAAWNALLLDFKLERIELLKNLKENYNLFLLSNSNIIHYDVFLKQFQQISGLETFDDIFDKAHYSFDMGIRKPNEEAYQYVIDQHQLNASRSLFIDDSEQNIKPAVNVGLKAYFHKPGEEMTDLFKHNLLREDLLIQ
tara:strand:- start:324 stop:971 length:648 start_codon:yes stop_codon:yes gene_type:complete